MHASAHVTVSRLGIICHSFSLLKCSCSTVYIGCVTVVLTTSPSPLHPSTEHIETVLQSIEEYAPVCYLTTWVSRPVVGGIYQLPVIGYRLSVIGYRLSVVGAGCLDRLWRPIVWASCAGRLSGPRHRATGQSVFSIWPLHYVILCRIMCVCSIWPRVGVLLCAMDAKL